MHRERPADDTHGNERGEDDADGKRKQIWRVRSEFPRIKLCTQVISRIYAWGTLVPCNRQEHQDSGRKTGYWEGGVENGRKKKRGGEQGSVRRGVVERREGDDAMGVVFSLPWLKSLTSRSGDICCQTVYSWV